MTTAAPGDQGGRTGVLVMAHGTPRSLEEIAGFYTEIRRGRPPSEEQLTELEDRYRAIGGTSPLNELTQAQVSGLAVALAARAPGRFLVVGGAKFAAPRIEDAVAELARAGVSRIIGLVLAPHSSTVSVGEYGRRAAEAIAREDPGRPLALTMIDHWYEEPGLVTLVAERVNEAIETLGEAARERVTVLFTAHSVPLRVVEAGDNYPEQLEESARAVTGAAGISDWSVAWQSAGRTDDEWLGPDVNAVISGLPETGATGVVVCPIGFVADHLEVLYDVDIEASASATKAGIAFARTQSLNDDPRFLDVLADAVLAAAD
ncbi:MAG TPA: ferrochelatase [Acidimicrobiales bacterium]|jgi:ferrochelatase